MKLISIVTLLSTLLININADSICGPGARFMVALKCGDGSTTLHCAPNNLKDRSNFCQNPNEKWAKAKCNNKGGLVLVDISNSGCFVESLCSNCDNPIAVPDLNPVNAGFESGDLTGWITTGPVGAAVLCDSTAPEGNCYAQLSTAGTGPGTDPNVLTNSHLVIPNYGGCNNFNHLLTFWYRFAAGDYLPFNDHLIVSVKDPSNNVVFSQTVDVATVGNYGDSGWHQAYVYLGAPPAGSAIYLSLSAETINVNDYILTSYSFIDGVQLLKL